jgi:hypothetical protein
MRNCYEYEIYAHFKVRQTVFLTINDKEKIVSDFGFLFMKC